MDGITLSSDGDSICSYCFDCPWFSRDTFILRNALTGIFLYWLMEIKVRLFIWDFNSVDVSVNQNLAKDFC